MTAQINAILTDRKLKKAEKARSRLDGDGNLLMNLTATSIQKDSSQVPILLHGQSKGNNPMILNDDDSHAQIPPYPNGGGYMSPKFNKASNVAQSTRHISLNSVTERKFSIPGVENHGQRSNAQFFVINGLTAGGNTLPSIAFGKRNNIVNTTYQPGDQSHNRIL